MKPGGISNEEKYRLITECRQSGQTDNQWCMDHGVSRGTFYRWIRELREKACIEIPERIGLPQASEKQDVVRIDIVAEENVREAPKSIEEHNVQDGLEHSTIEIILNGAQIKISNAVDPKLLVTTLRLLKEITC